MAKTIVSKDQLVDQIGKTSGPGPWITVDQARINNFADCTEDHQFIHIDEEKAAQTPFGGTIAHGFLTLSLLVKLSEDIGFAPENTVMGVNYGFNKIRFLSPVSAGKRIRAHAELINVDRKDENRFLSTQKITIEIEDQETPALVAEWLGMAVTG
ncbi:MAG: MaoC family dehydratase [Pseudomonadales bacterium]